jgi:hypothetical protein
MLVGAMAASAAFLACGISTQCQTPGDSPSIAAPAAPGPRTRKAPAPLPACIHGVVSGKNGELYEGVRVTLDYSGPDAPQERTLTTDSDGAFDFADAPVGTFTLTFTSKGFAAQTVSGVLHEGEDYNAQTIVLQVAETIDEVQVTASQQDIEVEQVREEEHQRVLGIVPNFYVTYVPNAPPLTRRQKYAMAWKTSIDPITWIASGGVAASQQADNAFKGYGQGTQGYAKRFGAAYGDEVIGTFLGGAVLPSIFKQDPRYFYKGTGTVRSRVLYAVATSVICKGDNGHWQLGYSGILGSMAAGEISNVYYPSTNKDGVGLMFEETGIGIAANAIANVFQEFVVRRLTPHVPHYEPPTP